jgi:hypothetical protein
MTRIDDYQQALALGKKELEGKNPDLVAKFAGAIVSRDRKGNTSLALNFLNEGLNISWPDLTFSKKESGEEVPIQQQILILHYLIGAFTSSGTGITGDWIAFHDVPDGKFYRDAFHRRAKNPMVQSFGEDPETLVELTKKAYGAVPFNQGDLSVLIKVFPLVSVVLLLWRGDEEFPPEGNILFDRNILQLLSAEDIAWLSGMIVYPLLRMAK